MPGRPPSSFTLLALATVTLAGCGAHEQVVASPTAPLVAAPASAPAPVERSLFAKDTGTVTEADLQTLLEAPVDLQFPARVGVVPLAAPFDPGAPVALGTRGVAAKSLASGLTGSTLFTHVSDVSTDLPHGAGLEGLRVLAARYRVRYLVLYSERYEDATHLNAWAWTYPTILGMFVAPGVTVKSHGLAQADLLDVRSGTVLFSAVEPMAVDEASWMVGAARSHREHQAEASAAAAAALAKQVRSRTAALLAHAEAHAVPGVATRFLPPAALRIAAPGALPGPAEAGP